MLCTCNNKRKRKQQYQEQQPIKYKQKLETGFTQEINDEAASLYQTHNLISNSNLFPNTLETFKSHLVRSGSNFLQSRSAEKLIQNIPNISPRKTSFSNFKNASTSPDTKFLSIKQGFALLVTKTK